MKEYVEREELLKLQYNSSEMTNMLFENADCPAELLVIHFDAIDNLVKEMVGDL